MDNDGSRTDPTPARAGEHGGENVLVVAAVAGSSGVRAALAEAGNGSFRVTLAPDFDGAADLLRAARFDAVVLELGGAGADPREAIPRLRALAGDAALIVAEAGDGSERAADGADDWIGPGEAADAVAHRVRGAIERQRLRAALAASEARFRAIIQRTADGIVIVGEDGRVRFVNPAAERLFGRGAPELAGQEFGFAVLAGETTEIDLVRPGQGEPVVAELRAGATTWEGAPAQVITLRDITDRKRAEERAQRLVLEQAARAEAERAGERARFLAEAGSALDSSLEPETTLLGLAKLIVPRMADWCVIDLLEGGRVRRVAGVHADPEKQPLLDELGRRFPTRPDSDQPAARVLRSGAPELHRALDARRLRELTGDEAHAELLRRLHIRSSMTVALRAREHRLGAITFVCNEHDFDADDLALALEIASRAGRALENAQLYAAALAANHAKADFLAVMSHELRTPLNAIIGYSQLLIDGIGGEQAPGQRGRLERIYACALHLLQLIDEILAYAQMEAGHAQAQASPITVGEMIGPVVAKAEPMAREKALELRVEVLRPEAALFTDAGKLRQIVLNLVANAVKFTERGTVGLRAEPSGDALLIAVSDTGPGISPADMERIYEPFWQAEQPLTRHAGGTGLGLSVSLRLAEMLGGTLTAESRPGAGSTFTVRVPARMRDDGRQ